MQTPAERRASLLAILSACAAFSIGMGITLPLLSLILERRGVPASLNGLNLATGGFAALVVIPLVPRWMARLGTARFLALALVVAASAMIALYEAPSLWLWFPIRFVLSAALNSLFVVSEYWINQLADARNRGRTIAAYSTCFAAGFGIGPALLTVTGTRGILPFVSGAGLLLLALVPIGIARRAAPDAQHARPAPLVTIIRAAPAIFCAAFAYGAIDAGLAGLVPVYAVRSGYSESAAALAVTAIGIGSIAFQIPLGALADRLPRHRVLLACAVAGLLGAAIAPFAVATHAAFYLVLFVWGGIVLGLYTVGLTSLGETFKGADLAGANAAYVMSYSLGLLVGPSLEGAALDTWNPNGLMLALGAIAAAYALFLTVRKDRDSTDLSAET